MLDISRAWIIPLPDGEALHQGRDAKLACLRQSALSGGASGSYSGGVIAGLSLALGLRSWCPAEFQFTVPGRRAATPARCVHLSVCLIIMVSRYLYRPPVGGWVFVDAIPCIPHIAFSNRRGAQTHCKVLK